jgi:hypothetical protein
MGSTKMTYLDITRSAFWARVSKLLDAPSKMPLEGCVEESDQTRSVIKNDGIQLPEIQYD